MKHIYIILLLVCIILICLFHPYLLRSGKRQEGMESKYLDEYIQGFKEKENRMFPFRYFTDENDRVLPFVAVTGFFREKAAEDRYNEYVKKGIKMFGITAYKSFPNRDKMDSTEGEYERNDTFDYIGNIRDWLCCFRDAEEEGFTKSNRLADISESDFYNAEDETQLAAIPKKYDFIYICNKDSEGCPLDGWNAFNRNFELAKKCFPVMCFELGLKGLIVGRENCGLEKEYGDYLEVIGWLDWHVLQEKMRESKFLFVPNIYDASPRVVAECLTKNLQVLMNRNIMCGFKYINYHTGELFNDETDVKSALTRIINKPASISPRKWWSENHSQDKSQKKLRDFLAEGYPGKLDTVENVKFIL